MKLKKLFKIFAIAFCAIVILSIIVSLVWRDAGSVVMDFLFRVLLIAAGTTVAISLVIKVIELVKRGSRDNGSDGSE
jgi:hypothetical protein